MTGLSRREFLARMALSAGAAATGGLGGASRPPAYEGIYTSKFTYRLGETVDVHLGLQSQEQVTLKLTRRSSPIQVWQYPIQGSPFWVWANSSAGFVKSLSIPTSDLTPGYYEVSIPLEALAPENQQNTWHSFPSYNHFAHFVLTPETPGSHSRLLWLHDSLTAAAYGSFGGRSIYGEGDVKVRTVSLARPGLNRFASADKPLRFYIDNGYEFEYVDLVALDAAPPGYLNAYDVVVMNGQFEYVPHGVMVHLRDYLAQGGSLFAATSEFAIWRVRLDHDKRQMTTYKWDAACVDPWNGDPAQVAGIGMTLDASVYETEITATTLWCAHRVSEGGWIDLPLTNMGEVGWLLDGTGLQEGDVLPSAFRIFGHGNFVAYDDAGKPFVINESLTRTPAETSVWSALTSPDGREWWNANCQNVGSWPQFSGTATATYVPHSGGGQILTLPSSHMLTQHTNDPLYQQVMLNIMAELAP